MFLMAQGTTTQVDWRKEFHEFEDVAYLNAAGQGPLPRAALRAAQQALEWKKLPHLVPDEAYFGLPDRVRKSVAQLIGGRAEEVAITTGASGGLAAVALGMAWNSENEVLIARGEFPAHFSTWMPMATAGRLQLRVVEPGWTASSRHAADARFLSAEDLLAAITPRTRLVSTSLVRFDDATRIETRQLADACHAVGAFLLLDVSQCAGAMPLDVAELGADFLVCAGYKWLLSPYGTGFFWVRRELIESREFGQPVPFYWMALEGAERFHELAMGTWRPTPDARRWDAPETASFFNLAAMEASLEFLLRAGVRTIWAHNCRLTGEIIERLPRDRCVLASPVDPSARGPFVCARARTPEKTRALYEKLREARVVVSLRENALRIAPHLYNTERDLDRLLSILAVEGR